LGSVIPYMFCGGPYIYRFYGTLRRASNTPPPPTPLTSTRVLRIHALFYAIRGAWVVCAGRVPGVLL